MKRHPALVPLSRDHHHVLVIARRLRHATTQNAAETARAFLAHWDAEEKQHFRLEEELLLPASAALGEPGHPAVIRTLLDHMLIRSDADRLADTPSLELLHELGAPLRRTRPARGTRALSADRGNDPRRRAQSAWRPPTRGRAVSSAHEPIPEGVRLNIAGTTSPPSAELDSLVDTVAGFAKTNGAAFTGRAPA